MKPNEMRGRVKVFTLLDINQRTGLSALKLEHEARAKLEEKLDILGRFDEFLYHRTVTGDFKRDAGKYTLTAQGGSQLDHWRELLQDWDNRVAEMEKGDYLLSGVQRIAKERHRQIHEEGFDAERDDQYYFNGTLGDAAACYAATKKIYYKFDMYDGLEFRFREMWPWKSEWDKRQKRPYPLMARNMMKNPAEAVDKLINIDGRIKELAKAGALCAADIDRLERLKKQLSKDENVR